MVPLGAQHSEKMSRDEQDSTAVFTQRGALTLCQLEHRQVHFLTGGVVPPEETLKESGLLVLFL